MDKDKPSLLKFPTVTANSYVNLTDLKMPRWLVNTISGCLSEVFMEEISGGSVG